MCNESRHCAGYCAGTARHGVLIDVCAGALNSERVQKWFQRRFSVRGLMKPALCKNRRTPLCAAVGVPSDGGLLGGRRAERRAARVKAARSHEVVARAESHLGRALIDGKIPAVRLTTASTELLSAGTRARRVARRKGTWSESEMTSSRAR